MATTVLGSADQASPRLIFGRFRFWLFMAPDKPAYATD
jgi:hypothetical protein